MARASTGEIGRHLRQIFGGGGAVGLSDGQLLERFVGAGRGRHDPDDAEAAFEAILARHGATVLSVCRQVLCDNHAAEDAFQATFLVLVRRARSLRLRDAGSLGSWLHGVAYRTALKARTGAARRRPRERRMARPEARGGTAVAAVEADDLGAVLHAEVVRLPARYRAAVVLCYFEGRTHDEAAATLGCPVGTVRGRLARARDLLRGRLARRGLAPSAAGLAAAGIGMQATAAVPAELLLATLDAAARCAQVPAMAAVVGGLPATRLRMALAAAAGLAALAAGTGLALLGATGLPPSSSAPIAADPAVAPAVAGPSSSPDEPAGESLPPHARARLGSSAFRHAREVNEVFTARDGKTLVTIDIDRRVHIWDAASGRLLHRIELAGRNFAPIALSPDGTTIATTEPDDEHRLRLWDVATGRERRRLHPPRGDGCDSPVFTPDGRSLVTVGYHSDRATQPPRWYLEVRDLTAASERRRRIDGDWSRISEAAVSPDGRTIAVVVNGVYGGELRLPNRRPGRVEVPGAIHLVNLATGRQRTVLGVEDVFVRSQAFSPDSRYLAIGLSDGTVRVYDTADGRERLPRMDHRAPVGPPPPWSDPEEEMRARAAGQRQALPMSTAYMTWLEVIDALAFSPDGTILAGGSRLITVTPSAGSLYFWDFARGRELRRVAGFHDGPISLSFAADGRTIAVAGTGEVRPRIWEVATGREALPQPGHTRAISGLAVAPVERNGLHRQPRRHGPSVGPGDGSRAGGGRPVQGPIGRPPGHGPRRPDAGDPGRLRRPGRLEPGGAPRRLPPRRLRQRRSRGLFPIAFSPDGRSVIHGRMIWEVSTGDRRAVLHMRDDPGRVNVWVSLYHPDGKRILTTGPGMIWAWDAASGEDLGVAVRGVAIRYGPAAISPDGRFLATSQFVFPANRDDVNPWIHVWDLAAGRESARLPAYEGSGSGLAFSPDGRLLAAFPSDQAVLRSGKAPDPTDPTIRVYEIATRRELRRLDGHRGPVSAAAFAPDGRSLISAGDDGTAVVWDVSDLKGR